MYYIYLIVNKVNGKTYIGQRKSSKEWFEDKYMGSGKRLKLAKQKYGIENFEKFLIQYCYSKEETDKAEKFWIAEYRSRGKAEYNIADGGEGGSTRKGKCCSEETKQKISESEKGKHHSEEARRKMSESRRGKHMSEEQKKKISESMKGKNKGKHLTDEQRQRISDTLKGRKREPHSEETRRKISEATKGKQRTEQQKQSISEAHKGQIPWNKGKHYKLVDGKRVWY